MKDIEWLKEEIGELPCVDTVFTSDGLSYMDSAIPVLPVYDLINQLDEPDEREKLEVAYKDILERGEFWFNDKKYVVVETVEITEEQAMEWLDNNYFYDHRTAETVLANAVDKGELGYYGTKYSVVKKEPETVEEVVADFGRSLERLRELWRSMEVEELE